MGTLLVLTAVMALAYLLVTALTPSISVALRTRSGLLAVDIVGAATVTTVIVWTVRTLADEGAAVFSRSRAGGDLSMTGALAVIAGILLAATAARVAIGRSDPRRGHLASSSVVWSGLGLCALAFFLHAQWILGTRPQDLRYAWLSVPPRGEGFLISGRSTRGIFSPAFLMDASGRQAERLPRHEWGEVWARDGSRVFWLDRKAGELATAWVGKPETGLTRTPLRLPAERQRALWLLAASPDGRRLLASDSDVLLLLDAQSGAEIGTVPLPGTKHGGDFVAPDRVRLIVAKGPDYWAEPRVFEADFTEGRATELGQIDVLKATNPDLIAVSPGFDRLLVYCDWMVGGGYPGLTLHSPQGRRLATIPIHDSRDSAFLADGRIVVADGGSGTDDPPEERSSLRVRIFTHDGVLLRATTVPLSGSLAESSGVRLNGEPSPGVIAICLSAEPAGNRVPAQVEAVFLDADSLEVRRREPGLGAAQQYQRSSFAPGSIRTRLFRNADGNIVWFDPATGEKRIVVDIAGDRSRSGSQ